MAYTDSIAGQKFGKLTAVKLMPPTLLGRRRNFWECLCDCGSVAYVRHDDLCGVLSKHSTRSCGCTRAGSLEGKTYGRLTVLRRHIADKGGKPLTHWLCRCACGNETIAEGTDLRHGYKASCGCLRFTVGAKQAALNQIINRYRQAAKVRRLDWALTQEQASYLLQQDCYYCGGGPSNIHAGNNISFRYNGIDRADNDAGYLPTNCVSSCESCNLAKRTMSVRTFIEWATRLVEHQKGKSLEPDGRHKDPS